MNERIPAHLAANPAERGEAWTPPNTHTINGMIERLYELVTDHGDAYGLHWDVMATTGEAMIVANDDDGGAEYTITIERTEDTPTL